MSDFNKQTISDIDVAGKRALVRVDFNTPLDKATGEVADDRRIREALPTIKYLIDRGAHVVLMSHLGRPDGKVNPKYSLKPVAERLAELLGKPVAFATDVIGPDAHAKSAALGAGQVMLLENVRFHAEEETNDPGFAKALASFGDLYVNDAFGTAHRAHASTEGVAKFLPAVAGFLMEKELTTLGAALENPERPFIAIIGGAKVSSKIDVLRNLLGRVDHLFVGGGMANTFFKAKGFEIGKSLVEDNQLELARQIMSESHGKLVLPVDVVVAAEAKAGVASRAVSVDAVGQDDMILDIGPCSVSEFARIAKDAKTVVWNGPLGLYEIPEFAKGTQGLAAALASTSAKTIVGGGDLVAALESGGLAEEMGFVSTGGGASLELLEGKVLPGVAALATK